MKERLVPLVCIFLAATVQIAASQTVDELNKRGNAKDDKGDFDGAIADYNRVIELDPKFAVAYNNRGNAELEKGNLDAATADFDHAIELDPNYGNNLLDSHVRVM